MRRTDDVSLWPWPLILEVMALAVDVGLRLPSADQLWSSQALPFGRYCTFYVYALVGLWPWSLTFYLETGMQCSTCHGVPSFIAVILRLFVFDLWATGPKRLRLITWPCDIDLWGNGACGWCGSSSSIRIPSLKFVSLAIRKIMAHDVCQR